MKKIFLTLTLIFTVNILSYSTNIMIPEPHTIITSCGINFTFDDEGMTQDQIWDLSDAVDEILCSPNDEDELN